MFCKIFLLCRTQMVLLFPVCNPPRQCLTMNLRFITLKDLLDLSTPKMCTHKKRWWSTTKIWNQLEKSNVLLVVYFQSFFYKKYFQFFQVEFLLIRPTRGIQMTMEKTFSKYWRKRKTLTIGHRGTGISFNPQLPK